MPTEDEKTQRLIAEKRHQEIVSLLQGMKDILEDIAKMLLPKVDEKKEGE